MAKSMLNPLAVTSKAIPNTGASHDVSTFGSREVRGLADGCGSTPELENSPTPHGSDRTKWRKR